MPKTRCALPTRYIKFLTFPDAACRTVERPKKNQGIKKIKKEGEKENISLSQEATTN